MNCSDCFNPIEKCTCLGTRPTLSGLRAEKLKRVKEWAERHNMTDHGMTDLEQAFDDARTLRL